MVSVVPNYEGDHLESSGVKHVFTYTVTITNQRSTAVQLIARRWQIFDSTGHHYEVKGEGVVGEQPVIDPETKYTYSSWCPLDSPLGSMSGAYEMLDVVSNSVFEIEIPFFELSTNWIKN
jgi:ApaG protein